MEVGRGIQMDGRLQVTAAPYRNRRRFFCLGCVAVERKWIRHIQSRAALRRRIGPLGAGGRRVHGVPRGGPGGYKISARVEGSYFVLTKIVGSRASIA